MPLPDAPFEEPLLPMDRMLSILHGMLRGRGHPGLLLQTQVWLSGQPDEAQVRQGVAGLARRFPLLRAQLVWAEKALRWRVSPVSECRLVVKELAERDDSAVNRYAERLFACPLTAEAGGLVEFHVLNRPSRRTVLLIRWLHVLMGPKGMEWLLSELDRPQAEGPERFGPPAIGMERSTWGRWLSSLAWLTWSAVPRGPVLRLNRVRATWTEPTRIDIRTLSADETNRLQARAVRLCGLPILAPVLVAAGFRAICRLQGHPPWPWDFCYTHLPIDPHRAGPVATAHNLHSYLMLQARACGSSSESLPAALLRQQLAQLRRGIDRDYLAGVELLARFPRLAPWLTRPLLFKRMSFAFGYHGEVSPGLDQLWGIPVERVLSGVPIAWSPLALWLSASQDRGRLNLMVTSIPTALPEGAARAFLEAVADELLGRDRHP